uniref:Noggin-like protein 2 n=1 Tax=Schmidtea mediterranea TaxID=79327 RepID=C1JAC2_SCHMD|nr:noggin-like protein 2 [Schmidtea mediterranea]
MYYRKDLSQLICLFCFAELNCQLTNESSVKPIENETESSNVIIVPVRNSYQLPRTNKFYPNVTQNIAKTLRQILDQEQLFDDWISSRIPKQIYIPFNGTKQVDVRIQFLVKMKNYTFKDRKGNKLYLSPNVVDSFRRWLEQESSCPMDYIWTELDPSFWPRWVKKGICVSVVSCSWPPGMNCKSKHKKKLTLLQWNCEIDPDKSKYKADTMQMRSIKRIRVKRQNKLHKRRNTSSKRRGVRKVMTSKSKELKNKKRILKLREHIDDFYCKWKKVTYQVIEFCSCYC